MEKNKEVLQKKISDLFEKNSAFYNEVAKAIPNEAPEKRIILEKITETGMWIRMWFEIELSPPVQIVVDRKKVNLSEVPYGQE